MVLPRRKHPRLKDYDYGQNGCYFVTICTKARRQILSAIAVGRDDLIPPDVRLTEIGKIVEEFVLGIESAYHDVFLDAYVIMPDHVHLLRRFDDAESGGMTSSRPTLQRVIRSMKTMVTKKLGYSVWQESFYDHVIRCERDYLDIFRYIESNPEKWLKNEP